MSEQNAHTIYEPEMTLEEHLRSVLINVGHALWDVEDWMHSPVDGPIKLRDHIAWRIGAVANWFFNIGYIGSLAERCSILNDEIPPDCLTLTDKCYYHLIKGYWPEESPEWQYLKRDEVSR